MQIKTKQVITNGVGVKQYSIFQEPNTSYRPDMEDTSFVKDCFLPNCPKSTLFAVFDGHGGRQISYRLVSIIPNAIKTNTKTCKGNMKMMLQKTFVEVLYCLSKIDKMIGEQYTGQAGSTATVGIINIEQAKRMLYIAHVGDSSAYLFEDHSFEQLTKEHRGNNMQQRSRVQANGGKILNNRLCGVLAVTRAFGDFPLKKTGLTVVPEIRKLQIRLSHKFLVVGSDGLWDFVEVKKVHGVIKQEMEAQGIGRKLLKMALQNGSNDNVTVLVLKLN